MDFLLRVHEKDTENPVRKTADPFVFKRASLHSATSAVVDWTPSARIISYSCVSTVRGDSFRSSPAEIRERSTSFGCAAISGRRLHPLIAMIAS